MIQPARSGRQNIIEILRKGIEHTAPEICANVIIGLIKVANHLLGILPSLLQSVYECRLGLMPILAHPSHIPAQLWLESRQYCAIISVWLG